MACKKEVKIAQKILVVKKTRKLWLHKKIAQYPESRFFSKVKQKKSLVDHFISFAFLTIFFYYQIIIYLLKYCLYI